MSETDPEASTIAADLPLAAAGAPTEALGELVAGRYELLGMLGAGGMGTVYRVRDRELDEIVALKVLKKELASPAMLERFRREVKLARKVTHANVARTFDIGEHGGDRFLTMELVEGEMLAALLARRRRLPDREAVAIALDVCAGLAAAHEAGVLHRDLKPENVIVARGGRAVITDFGIARAVVAGEATRTAVGIVGTPAYMAPEQVEGAADLDARADLYALGAMLYELVTGEVAWPGDTAMAVAAARLVRPPPDPRAVVATVAPALGAVILRLMARARADRYPSALAVAEALREAIGAGPHSAAGPVSAAPASAASLTPVSLGPLAPAGTLRLTPPRAPGARVVAVLPPTSSAAEDAYLVEGLHEDVIDLLSVVPGLFVRPRGEVARLVGVERDPRAVGQALGADVVVDASLRRVAGGVRIAFRLVAVEDGFQLWAKRFDRAAAEVLAVADEAAAAIAHALTTELAVRGRTTPAVAEAEDLFLRGRFALRRGWGESARDAAELLGHAQRLAPDDARIAATHALALARAYGLELFGEAALAEARALASRALAAAPALSEAHVALGLVDLQLQDGVAAVAHFRRALALAPGSIDALDWLGRLLGEIGLVDEAERCFARATALDAEVLQSRQQLARICMIVRDGAGLRDVLGPRPAHAADVIAWYIVLGREALWRADRAAARALRAEVAELTLPTRPKLTVLSYLGVGAGEGAANLADRAQVERLLPVGAGTGPRRSSGHAQIRAELFAAVGRHDDALAAIALANAHRLLDVVWLDRCPLFAPLRGRPELAAIRAEVAARAEAVTRAFHGR